MSCAVGRFGGGGGDWDDEDGAGPVGPSGSNGTEDAAMATDEERTPVPEGDPAEQGGADGDAAGPSRARRQQPPVSCNKRLKREFRARKSLAGAHPHRLMFFEAQDFLADFWSCGQIALV